MHDYWTTPEKKRKKEKPVTHGRDVWVPHDLRGRAVAVNSSASERGSAPSPNSKQEVRK